MAPLLRMPKPWLREHRGGTQRLPGGIPRIYHGRVGADDRIVSRDGGKERRGCRRHHDLPGGGAYSRPTKAGAPAPLDAGVAPSAVAAPTPAPHRKPVGKACVFAAADPLGIFLPSGRASINLQAVGTPNLGK